MRHEICGAVKMDRDGQEHRCERQHGHPDQHYCRTIYPYLSGMREYEKLCDFEWIADPERNSSGDASEKALPYCTVENHTKACDEVRKLYGVRCTQQPVERTTDRLPGK